MAGSIRSTSRRLPLAVFALVAIGLVVAAIYLDRSMRAGARRRAGAELDAVAQLKVASLSTLRADVEEDTFNLATYPVIHKVAGQRGPLAPDLVAHAREVLATNAVRERFELISILDPSGRPLVEHRVQDASSFPIEPELLTGAVREGVPAVSALFARVAEGFPRLDVATAIRDPDGLVLGVLYARRNLSPAVRELSHSWPVPSQSAEAVLIRRDGDAALFITDPRSRSGWAMLHRAPFGQDARGVVQVAQGREGTFEAIDFQGVPIVVAARRIPNSDWFVTTRVNAAEVEAPVAQPVLVVVGSLALLLIFSGTVLVLWWRREDRQLQALSAAKAEVEESEERLRLALAGTHRVWDWDLQHGRLTVEEGPGSLGTPLVLLGPPSAALEQLVAPEDVGPVARQLEAHLSGQAEVFEAEFRTVDPDGSTRWISMRGRVSHRDEAGRPRRAIGVLADVTAQRELQTKLERSERMVSLGTLAAGVAHEINNPLTFVLDAVTQLEEEVPRALPDRPDLAEAATMARDGAQRVRDVVRGLRAFSSPIAERRREIEVADEVDAAIRLAGNELRHRAQVEVRRWPAPRVLAVDHQLGQVFLNLLLNAAQAMPEGHASSNSVIVTIDTAPNGWARVRVSDTGSGIPAHVLPRIFEPFFTTKATGTGTGLGLAIAHGVVTACGGRIEVDSPPSSGATFRVLLPPAPPRSTPALTPPAMAAVAPTTGGSPLPRALVIDDDPLVARSIARALRGRLDVAQVASAAEALERMATERFDVMVCDLMMPEMTGMELHDRVAALDPQQARRFVFVTGGAFTEAARAFLDRSTAPRVEKPFEPVELRRVVETVARSARS